MDSRLVFLDLETTGLAPRCDHILEVGLLIVDGATLRLMSPGRSWLIATETGLWPVPIHPEVQKMHTESGLWAALEAMRKATAPGKLSSVRDVEAAIIRVLRDEYAFKPGECMIAGYSIHFDRAFIAHWMPTLDQFLSHKMVDVSAFRTMARLLDRQVPEQVKAHRALHDCADAYCELSTLMQHLGVAREEVPKT